MQFVKLYRDCSPVSEAEGRQEEALGPMCPEAGVQGLSSHLPLAAPGLDFQGVMGSRVW